MEHHLQDKRIEKGEQMRARILHTAITLIAEQGIKELSAAKLAQTIGMSKSNVFHHFKSIDEILSSAVHIVFEDLSQPLKQEYQHIEEFLDALGHSIHQVPEEYLLLFKAILSFYHEGIFNSNYQEILSSYANQTTQLIEKQLVELVPHPVAQDTLRAISTILLTSLDGMGLHYWLNEHKDQYELAWQLQKKMILQYLGGEL
ncbi:TetR/AcrR family transcriptional regulator [Caldalkalibacillus mannanilyticus]|uniref:TetR/AcrR family transcriptional regulator n=1 Tax=Caldalkalibacillus mannanilyticus TaxID=1418 RepID=UPI00046AE7C2|nr:TetR/AcrR family transcriptional regulator [Caldalkalibacillus mannanilyticus]